MEDSGSRGTAKRAVRATLWFAAGSYVTLAIALVRSIILARILAPEDFGVVAFALFLASLFGLIRSAGLNYALIHQKDPDEDSMATFLASGLVLSVLALLVAVIAAPMLGGFYSADIVWVMLALMVIPVLHAGASLPTVMMEKELQFARITTINLVAAAAKSVIPIWMALNGFGLWAIVAVEVIDAVTRLILAWALRRDFPGLRMSMGSISYYWDYGKKIWSASVAGTIIFHFSNFVVGTATGLRSLGFFSKAQEFSQFPTMLTSSIISRVTLPTYAKLQDDRKALSRAFEIVLSAVMRVSAWFGLLLVVGVYELTVILLGERWLPLVVIVQVLAAWVVLRPAYDDSAALVTAVGRPDMFSKLAWVQAIVLLVAGPLLTMLWGLLGAAAAIDLMIISGLAYFYLVQRRAIIDVSARRIFVVPLSVASVSAVAVFIGADNLLSEPSLDAGVMPWVVKFAFEAAAATVLYLGGLLLLEKRYLSEQVSFVRRVVRDEDGQEVS